MRDLPNLRSLPAAGREVFLLPPYRVYTKAAHRKSFFLDASERVGAKEG